MSFKQLLCATPHMDGKYFEDKVVRPDDTNIMGNKGAGAFSVHKELKQMLCTKAERGVAEIAVEVVGGDRWRLL